MARNSPPQSHSKKRVLIVDDHPMVREHLTEVIRREKGFEVCGEVSEAGAVIGAIAKLRPELLLLDLNLKGVFAFDLIKDIKARYESLPIIVVSMHDESVFAERVLRAGASGYVSKEDPSKTVVEAMSRALTGQTYVSDRMAARLTDAYVRGRHKQSKGSLDLLSDRELEIFELMGHGLGTRRIAEKLRIDVRTVETYYTRMKAKLRLENSMELLMRAIEWVQTRRAG